VSSRLDVRVGVESELRSTTEGAARLSARSGGNNNEKQQRLV